MLVGKYVSPSGEVMKLEGFDFDLFATFRGTPENYKRYWEPGIEPEYEEDIRLFTPYKDYIFQVNSGDIRLDNILLDGKKANYNLDAFSRIGSIIRGMRIISIPQREVDFYSMGTLGERVTKSVETFSYKGNTISIESGYIVELSYKGEDEEYLYLKETEVNYVNPIKFRTTSRRKVSLILDEFYDTSDLPEVDVEDFNISDDDDDEDVKVEGFKTVKEIIKTNKDKSYSWLKDRKYYLIKDLDTWKVILRFLLAYDGLIAFDTETTGLNVTFKSASGQGDTLVGIVLSVESSKFLEFVRSKGVSEEAIKKYKLDSNSWYIPFQHLYFKNICPISKMNSVLTAYFKTLLETKDLVTHRGSFDAKVMFIYGIKINIVHDTYVLMKLSYSLENTFVRAGLKSTAKRFLHRDSLELSDFVDGSWGGVGNDLNFRSLPASSTKYYACPDTDNTLDIILLAIKEDWFSKFNMKRVYELEVQFTSVIAYQEFFGHHVRPDDMETLKRTISEELEKYEALIYEEAGYTFKISSSIQLAKVLYTDLGLPIIATTNTGKPKTDKETLKTLSKYTDSNGKQLYPITSYLLSRNEYSKLQTNFTNTVDKISTADGYMFSEVKQFLETGRLSVSDPNYQSYSDAVKKYISPRPNFYMMDSDYSSVEIRIMMSMANETEMIHYLEDPDFDYHRQKASQMFGVPYELVTSKQRQNAKGTNFGIVYGMSDRSLGGRIYGVSGAEADAKGATLRALYFKGMETTKVFIAKNLDLVVQNNFAATYFGRRRYFSDNMSVGSKKRQGGNHPIQGTAADLYKQAMVNLYKRIIDLDWWGLFLLPCFIHDEVLIECHNTINPAKALKVIRESLMLSIDGWCPLYIGFGYGANWYNAKKTEVPVQLQERFINEYGEEGFPFWDGNIDKLYMWEVNQIKSYRYERVYNYLKSPSNKGKVLHPDIVAYCFEVMGYLKDIRKFYKEVDNLKDISNKYFKDFDTLTSTIKKLKNNEFSEDELKTFEFFLPKGSDISELDELLAQYPKVSNIVSNLLKYLSNRIKGLPLSVDYYTRDLWERLDKAESAIFVDKFTKDNFNDLLSQLNVVLSELSKHVFLDGIVTLDFEGDSITDTFNNFGKCFGVSDVVEASEFKETAEVETKEVAVEEFDIKLEEPDSLEIGMQYVKSTGSYTDYLNYNFFVNMMDKEKSPYVLGALVDAGIVSKKKNSEKLEVARKAFKDKANYFKVCLVTNIDFDSGEFDIHEGEFYISTDVMSVLSNRLRGIISKIKV